MKGIPKPSEKRIALRVKPAAERALRQGHPWLFDRSIRRQSHEGKAGDLAVIFDRKDRFLAIGLYDPYSPIRVRVLQHNQPEKIDLLWFQKRLKEAAGRRKSILGTVTTAYRLVHGENDGFPGLVVDKYMDNYVAKLYSHAWIPHLGCVAKALETSFQLNRLVLRLSRSMTTGDEPLFGLNDGQVLLGPTLKSPILFMENGLRFEADLLQGQKTGFFLDQRDNRARVEELVTDADSLKHVLNVFAYSGAFSLYAARGGARHIVSIDASAPALDAAQRNFELNRDYQTVADARHRILVGDAFELMDRLITDGQQFDLIIIDPPSFASRQEEVGRALRSYSALARAGVSLLRSGGRLVMSSCSSRVEASMFFECVRQASKDLGRQLQELARTGHPIDHPVSFPQGAYLKCLFAVAP